jgi:hypothetical protein
MTETQIQDPPETETNGEPPTEPEAPSEAPTVEAPADTPPEQPEAPPEAPSESPEGGDGDAQAKAATPGVLRHVGSRSINVAGPTGAVFSSFPGDVFAVGDPSDYDFLVGYRTDRDPDEAVYEPASAIVKE